MLLKRLELQGFKSFADKTSLDLSSNIVAVVGPNGSGKSNVTDAIRWLLGERDARNLRGGKVEDLIFAGNDKRPRMGLAQATLYFDNSTHFFPVDFAEVSISRRVTRDGESQFFLNKAEVRLKDVVDFFAKSKLGARGLTIITQGSSDMFIKSSPLERREMIEEILGLKEYQIKKADAIRKLKNTAQNLTQVAASLEELKPHLRFLKKQVSRYEDREGIAKELSELENSFYGRRLKSLAEELVAHKAQLQKIDTAITEQEKVCAGLEEQFSKVKDSEPAAADEYRKIEIEKANLMNSRAALQKEFGKLEARIEFQARSIKAPSADLARLVGEIKDIAKSAATEESIDSLREKVNQIVRKIDEALTPKPSPEAESEKEELKKLNAEILGKLKAVDEEIKKLSQKEEEIRARLGNFNKDFSSAYEILDSNKKKLGSLKDEKNRTGFSIERVELRLKDLREELGQIGRTAESFEVQNQEDLPSEISQGENWEGEITRRMFKLRGDLAAIGEVDENLLKEAKETEARFEFLTKETADLETASRDLKILIKELDEKLHKEFTEAIHKINAEFEKLMHLMFGGGKARLVVKDLNEKPAEAGEDSATESKIEAAGEQAEEENDLAQGVEIEVGLPRKRVTGLEVLSGGERTLVSVAVIFALISVSPPPFLVLDEIDAALDEGNARRCSQILKEFSKHTQFVLITHNRATMEAANVLYGVTMGDNGTSRILSLKLTDKEVAEAA